MGSSAYLNELVDFCIIIKKKKKSHLLVLSDILKEVKLHAGKTQAIYFQTEVRSLI